MTTLRQMWMALTPAQRARLRRWLLKRPNMTTGPGGVPVPETIDPGPFAQIEIARGEAGNNPMLRAPCCRRPTAADGLIHIAPIALNTRVGYLTMAGIKNPAATFLCTICLQQLARTGVVPKWQIYRALGASDELVAKIKASEGE